MNIYEINKDFLDAVNSVLKKHNLEDKLIREDIRSFVLEVEANSCPVITQVSEIFEANPIE